MGVSNGIITAPINAADPYTCMGVAATADGYELRYICQNSHGKINKWARSKPYNIVQLTELTDAQKKGVLFGLTPPLYANGNWLTAVNREYTYNPPTTGDKRLTDFIEYSHNALPPCEAQKDITTRIDSAYIDGSLRLNHYGHDSRNIGLDEIFAHYMGWYLAFIIDWKGTGVYSDALWKTADVSLADGGYSVKVDIMPQFDNKRYWVCAASRINSSLNGNFSNVDFMALPFLSPAQSSAKLHIDRTSPLSINFIGCASSMTGEVTIKEEALPGGIAFPMRASTGEIWVESVITNVGGSAVNISEQNVTGRITPAPMSWSDLSSNTGDIALQVAEYTNGAWKLLANTGASISSGQTRRFRFGKTNWGKYKNGVLNTGTLNTAIIESASIDVSHKPSGWYLGGGSGYRMSIG